MCYFPLWRLMFSLLDKFYSAIPHPSIPSLDIFSLTRLTLRIYCSLPSHATSTLNSTIWFWYSFLPYVSCALSFNLSKVIRDQRQKQYLIIFEQIAQLQVTSRFAGNLLDRMHGGMHWPKLSSKYSCHQSNSGSQILWRLHKT